MNEISAPVTHESPDGGSDSEPEFVKSKSRKANPAGPSRGSQGKAYGKGRPNYGKYGAKDPSGALSDALIATWRRGDDDLEPSAKMLALIDTLEESEATGDKTIVYSQCECYCFICLSITKMAFITGTSMLDLIEVLFARHGIRSLRFDGKMDRASRESTLKEFKQPGGPSVILIR